MCDGGGSPGGADRPGGTAGSPGGAVGRTGAGSGDTGNDSGGVLARDTSGNGLLSASTMTGEGERTAGAVAAAACASFCLLVFVVDAGGFGVAGREEEASEEAFVADVFRSFVVVVDRVLLLAAMEPELCCRVLIPVRRCCREVELCIALVWFCNAVLATVVGGLFAQDAARGRP